MEIEWPKNNYGLGCIDPRLDVELMDEEGKGSHVLEGRMREENDLHLHHGLFIVLVGFKIKVGIYSTVQENVGPLI